MKAGRVTGQRALLALGAAALLLAGVTIAAVLPYANANKTQAEPIAFTGTWQAGEEAESYPLSGKGMDACSLGRVVVRGHMDRPMAQGEQLFFFIEYLEVRIYLDGVEIYAFGEEDARPAFARSSGITWAHLAAPRDVTPLDEWVIVLESKYKNNYGPAYHHFLDSFHTGDSGALARAAWARNWPYEVGGLVLFFTCLALLAFAIILAAQGISVHSSVYLFICYALSISVWIGLNPHFISLLFDNPVLTTQLETMAIMLSAILLVAYLGSFLQTKAKRLNNALVLVCAALGTAYLALQLLGLTDAYAVRTAMVLCMGSLGLAEAGEAVYEIRHSKASALRFLRWPGLAFLLLSTVELINYELELLLPGQSIFMGLLVLIGTQAAAAARCLRSALLMARQAARLEKELAESRIAVTLSQIQPHFLFNTLLGIRQLCDTDPNTASTALEHFAYYLRGNLDSLSNEGLITFEKELEHVENYLFLEQMRFGERLRIQWEIEEHGFLIPPLTLQPIVENAVRHGIAKREMGGTLIIRSERVKGNAVVTVTDDGPGLCGSAPGPQGSSHIGLANVESRLKAQAGGELRLYSPAGGGTAVRIILPQEEGEACGL